MIIGGTITGGILSMFFQWLDNYEGIDKEVYKYLIILFNMLMYVTQNNQKELYSINKLNTNRPCKESNESINKLQHSRAEIICSQWIIK